VIAHGCGRLRSWDHDKIVVLHLINSEGYYGAEHLVFNLVIELAHRGFGVTLGCLGVAESPGGEIGRRLVDSHIPVIFINENKKISLGGLARICKALKRSGANIIHTHGYKATVLGGLVAFLMGIPGIATYHGEVSQLQGLSTYAVIESFFLRLMDHVVAVSGRVKEELITRGVKERNISVICNGIMDIACGHPLRSSSQFPNAPGPKLLCIGRLISLKKFDMVIKAVGILKAEYPEVVLSIAGTGPMANELKKLATDLGLEDSVRLLGYVNNTGELYCDADIFLLPSETEGAPIVLLEAMAMGLPIIATSVGGISEMISHGKEAHIVPPNSLNKLVESVRYLVSNPDYARGLGMAARQAFEDKYTTRGMVNSYLERYRTATRL
jgi:glycosyltransferase involved in cell wall biosynthesis